MLCQRLNLRSNEEDEEDEEQDVLSLVNVFLTKADGWVCELRHSATTFCYDNQLSEMFLHCSHSHPVAVQLISVISGCWLAGLSPPPTSKMWLLRVWLFIDSGQLLHEHNVLISDEEALFGMCVCLTELLMDVGGSVKDVLKPFLFIYFGT